MGLRIKQLIGNQGLLLFLRLALGGIFIAASLGKVVNPDDFVKLVISYNILPENLAQLFGLFLPWVELVVGSLLILGVFSRLASGISLALIAGFIAFNSYSLACGSEASCGCFGQAMPLSNTQSLFLDGAMLLMAALILLHRDEPWFAVPRISASRAFSATMAILLVLGSFLPQATPVAANANVNQAPAAISQPVASNTAACGNVEGVEVENVSRVAQNTPSRAGFIDQRISSSLQTSEAVLLFFYADWCGFCKKEKPIIDALEQQYSGQITFLRLNNEKEAEALKKFGVTGFPTMYLITGEGENGNYVSQKFVGFTDETKLKASFNPAASGGDGPSQGRVSATIAPPANDPAQNLYAGMCFEYSNSSQCIAEPGCYWCPTMGKCYPFPECVTCDRLDQATCMNSPVCNWNQTNSRCVSICGNQTVDSGEECDGSSHCNQACLCENGYMSQNGVCVPHCGDGITIPPEQCEYVNGAPTSHCNISCQCEAGYVNDGGNGCKLIDSPLNCMDYSDQTECQSNSCSWCESYGVCMKTVEGIPACSCAYWTNESDCSRRAGCQFCSDLNVCLNENESCLCGNQTVDSGEECDGSSHCNQACLCENGYTSQNGVCVPYCGDGIILPPEQCEYVNGAPTSHCNSSCQCEAGYGPDPANPRYCKPLSYTLSVSKSGSGGGTLASDPMGISCGTNCSATWEGGSTVTLTAAPAQGSRFSGWSGACTNLSGPCTVSLNDNKSATAIFTVELNPVIIVHDVSPHVILPGKTAHTAIWDALNRAEKDKAACDEIKEAEAGTGVWELAPAQDHIWLRPGNWVQVTSTIAATTAYIQFPYSDGNDGVADIYVDGQKVTSLNTNMKGWWFLEIGGLPNTTHTVNVVGVGDVHVDYFGFGGTFIHPGAVPTTVNQGQTVTLSAKLTRDGTPISGKNINFYRDNDNYVYDASDILIATGGPTDANGNTSAAYVANTAGSFFVFAGYAGDATNKAVINDICTTVPDIAGFQVTDVMPPTATPSQNPPVNTNGWNNTNVTVNWNWTDNTGGLEIDPAICTTSSTSSGEGEIVLNASCTDMPGNTGSAAYTVRVDKTAPVVTINSPQPKDYLSSETLTINFSVTDAHSGVDSTTVTLDGNSFTDQTISLADKAGSHIFTVTATDKAGNSTTTSVTFSVIMASAASTVDIDPNTLNLKSQSDKNAITAYIELPNGYNVAQIKMATVKLVVNGVTIDAQPTPTSIGDYDGDKILDRMVKFDRQAVITALAGKTGDTSITVTGQLNDGRKFTGSDTIKVINPGK